MRSSKKERQQRLAHLLQSDPFLTDEEVARLFQVSIQTIRLDRMELKIPELRERIKQVAEESLEDVRSLAPDEVIGEIVEIQLGFSGVSLFEVKKEHVFARTHIARGHHLFAQANSLAIALMDAEVALTATAGISFVRPVRLGEKCTARAHVVRESGSRTQVDVITSVEGETVFQGVLDLYRSEDGEAWMRGGKEE
ncbi:transcription factor FapR [Mechercharimyces sp. CAU 1602]|uniref:transcription factor FapR n=1 Tax=Mechercharimyces sp. CAU 1602 TaxID=2973933 RepID=UPI0021620362|nr:transcription factor FapR [Mechercharimyces sp. CAU 1602]MCS1351368.1 transcription factor FapR [Mechercharimyces sp. CAU 1602]